MNYEDFEYVQNLQNRQLFCFDINRAIPPATREQPYVKVSKKDFSSSDKLQEYIDNSLVRVVTKEVLAAVAERRAKASSKPASRDGAAEKRVVKQPSRQYINPSDVADSPEDFDMVSDRPKAKPLPRKSNPIMVDEEEASRVRGASDSKFHTQHVDKNYRKGSQRGIIVDEYDDPETYRMAEASRTSYLVEDEDRGHPRRDTRMSAGPDHEDHELPPIELPEMPMAHLYQERDRDDRVKTASTTDDHGFRHKADSSWKDNPIVRDRMRDNVSGSPHSDAWHDDADQRITSKTRLNPAFDAEVDESYADDADDQLEPNALIGELLEETEQPAAPAKASRKGGRKKQK